MYVGRCINSPLTVHNRAVKAKMNLKRDYVRARKLKRSLLSKRANKWRDFEAQVDVRNDQKYAQHEHNSLSII